MKNSMKIVSLKHQIVYQFPRSFPMFQEAKALNTIEHSTNHVYFPNFLSDIKNSPIVQKKFSQKIRNSTEGSFESMHAT